MVIGRYAAYLARRLKYTSFKQYLNILRILHVEVGLPNPLADNWFLQSILKGILRIKGNPPNGKLPITPDIILGIRANINHDDPLLSVFWAACLIAFYGLLSKATPAPPPLPRYEQDKHLSRSDFHVYPWGIGVNIRHSKTI